MFSIPVWVVFTLGLTGGCLLAVFIVAIIVQEVSYRNRKRRMASLYAKIQVPKEDAQALNMANRKRR